MVRENNTVVVDKTLITLQCHGGLSALDNYCHAGFLILIYVIDYFVYNKVNGKANKRKYFCSYQNFIFYSTKYQIHCTSICMIDLLL